MKAKVWFLLIVLVASLIGNGILLVKYRDSQIQINSQMLESQRLYARISNVEEQNANLQRSIENLQESIERTQAVANNRIEALEKQIEELKHNYTYVRLALFVSTQYLAKTELSNPAYLRTLLHETNDIIWEPLKVKFLITVVNSDEYATTVGACNRDSHVLADSNRVFGYHHFTAFVVNITRPWAGCIPNDQGPREDTMVLDEVIFRNLCFGPSGACGAQYAAEVITHEFLHLMGFTDKALHVGIKFEGTHMVIPLSWYRQILGRISWFTINVG